MDEKPSAYMEAIEHTIEANRPNFLLIVSPNNKSDR